MVNDNYAKPGGRKIGHQDLFFFDTGDIHSVVRALDAARALSRPGFHVSVWKPLREMPADVRCTGHAPGPHNVTCLNCGHHIFKTDGSDDWTEEE